MSNRDLNFSDIQKALEEHSYVNIPFLIERPILEEAIEAFFKFLEEPESVKSHIDFTIAPLHRRGDVGFKHRDPNDGMYNDRAPSSCLCYKSEIALFPIFKHKYDLKKQHH